jgi:hypothetical protein
VIHNMVMFDSLDEQLVRLQEENSWWDKSSLASERATSPTTIRRKISKLIDRGQCG